MNPRFTLAVLVVAGALIAPTARADDTNEFWFEAGMKHRLAEQLDLRFATHWRTDGQGDTHSVMPELTLVFNPKGFLSFSAGYRHIRTLDDASDWRTRHRFFADVDARWRLPAELQLRYRLRWQGEFRDEDDDGSASRYLVRNQVALRWKHGDWLQPFVAAEIFNRLDRRNAERITQTRYSLGNSFEWRNHELSLFLRREVPHSDYDPDIDIVGLEYQIRW
jgi:hypothetical protein